MSHKRLVMVHSFDSKLRGGSIWLVSRLNSGDLSNVVMDIIWNNGWALKRSAKPRKHFLFTVPLPEERPLLKTFQDPSVWEVTLRPMEIRTFLLRVR